MENEQVEKVEEIAQTPEHHPNNDDDDGPPPGFQTILSVPQPRLPEPEPEPEQKPEPESTPKPATTTVKVSPSGSFGKLKCDVEIAQMVCGSCRRLLSYPPGARRVLCSCCQTINLVLQAHQVGQVKCRDCAVLLMYPYGAPQVKCSSCLNVTEIGALNERPPWSVQQGHSIP